MTARYQEARPPDSLAGWVECGWAMEAGSAIGAHRVPPDGCLDIIYDRLSGLRAIGTMTVEQRIQLAEGVGVAGIRFQPGVAGRFLGVSPAELTDGSAALQDLWPRRARELERRLEDARSIQEAMRILLGTVCRPAAAPNPVERAIQAMAAANGNVDLDGVARDANVSLRQFRRRCLEVSGLTPKLLCRVLRFRHAWRMAGNAQRPDWPGIAFDAGYFDQAHFIHDFREFAGDTPMAVFSNTASGPLG